MSVVVSEFEVVPEPPPPPPNEPAARTGPDVAPQSLALEVERAVQERQARADRLRAD